MDEDGIAITDSNYREPVDGVMERRLKEYEAEKLRQATEKEQAMLDASWERSEKRSQKRQKFINGIKKIFARKNNELQQYSDQAQR